jgi:hypothetical protein
VPKHKGISYFIIPMDIPGLTLSPIIDMTTAHSLTKRSSMTFAFLRNISLDKKATGGDLRKSRLQTNACRCHQAGSLWGSGPSADDLLNLVRSNGGCDEPGIASAHRRLAY